MKKRFPLIFFILLIIFNCNKNNSSLEKGNYLNALSKNVHNKLSEINYNPIFIKCQKNNVFETNNIVLYEIYTKFYFHKYHSYDKFLKGISDENFELNLDIANYYKYDVFKIDENIMEKDLISIKKDNLLYNKSSNSYCVKNEESINIKTIKTIAYKMYLENYIIKFDNLHGNYIMTPFK